MLMGLGTLMAFVWGCGDAMDGEGGFGGELADGDKPLEAAPAEEEQKSDEELLSAEAAEESAPAQRSTTIDGKVGTTQEALNNYYAVGILPMDITRGQVCPNDSQHVWFTLDTEDSGSDTSWDSDWRLPSAGNYYSIEYPYQVTLQFCKVSGEQFKPKKRSSGSFNYDSYAVLKLGTECPLNSYERGYYVDTEDAYNKNKASTNIAPNVLNKYGVNFKFCIFREPFESSSSMTSFPNLGVPYAVFGDYDDPAPYALAKRFIYTDDENTGNANRYIGRNDAILWELMDFVQAWGAPPTGTYFEFLQVR